MELILKNLKSSGKFTKLSLKSLLLLALSSCSVEIPNVKVCATAGVFVAGADCVNTQTNDIEEMGMEEFIYFLEPQPEHPDPSDPNLIIPERGAALCQSADDYRKVKTALEQACKKLGTSCSKEIQDGMEIVSKKVEALQNLSMKKKKYLIPVPLPFPKKEIPREQLNFSLIHLPVLIDFGPPSKFKFRLIH